MDWLAISDLAKTVEVRRSSREHETIDGVIAWTSHFRFGKQMGWEICGFNKIFGIEAMNYLIFLRIINIYYNFWLFIIFLLSVQNLLMIYRPIIITSMLRNKYKLSKNNGLLPKIISKSSQTNLKTFALLNKCS